MKIYKSTSKELSQDEYWDIFIKNGNEEALSHIYYDNYDLLFDYGHKFTSNVNIIEDAIQDIFINIIKSRKNIGLIKNLKGYLICAFRRQLFLDLNKQNKMVSTGHFQDDIFDYLKRPDLDFSEKENQEFIYTTIEKCISNLTPKQQEILFLRFERELSYSDIAKALNISIDSCYKSIYRTIKTIREEATKTFVRNGKSIFGLTINQSSGDKSYLN